MLIVINISRVLYHARDYNPAIFQIINKANVDEFSRLCEDKRQKRNDGAPGQETAVASGPSQLGVNERKSWKVCRRGPSARYAHSGWLSSSDSQFEGKKV
jgi:hypothetical protein